MEIAFAVGQTNNALCYVRTNAEDAARVAQAGGRGVAIHSRWLS